MLQIKNLIRNGLHQLAVRRGIFVPFSSADLATVPREPIPFSGDIPTDWGTQREIWTTDFLQPRKIATVTDLVYTSDGMAWVRGQLHQQYSLRQPSAHDLFRLRSPRPETELDDAVVIQAQTPYTYGDWVGQHLMTLVSRLPLSSPLLLPQSIYDRSYVQRDLKLLAVNALRTHRTVLIRQATVLPQDRPNHSFSASDIFAYRKAFGINPSPPKPGSLLYLSREGEIGAASRRTYPSGIVAALVRKIGGKVLLAAHTTLDIYRSVAEQAETVIADHGSALCNLLLWKTRNVVELMTDDWWNPYFLFLAHATGVSNYRLFNVSGYESKLPDLGRLEATLRGLTDKQA